jgi:fructokinase
VLAPLFDLTLAIEVPMAELRRRLVERWLQHGLDPAAAAARAEGNDLANARLVAERSRPADIRLPHADAAWEAERAGR